MFQIIYQILFDQARNGWCLMLASFVCTEATMLMQKKKEWSNMIIFTTASTQLHLHSRSEHFYCPLFTVTNERTRSTPWPYTHSAEFTEEKVEEQRVKDVWDLKCLLFVKSNKIVLSKMFNIMYWILYKIPILLNERGEWVTVATHHLALNSHYTKNALIKPDFHSQVVKKKRWLTI